MARAKTTRKVVRVALPDSDHTVRLTKGAEKFRELCEIAGKEAAIALCEARGGCRVRIPARMPDDHWLIELVGEVAARKLSNYYRAYTANTLSDHELGVGAGASLDVPLAIFARTSDTPAKVVELTLKDLSASAIARKLGVTTRTVYRNRASAREMGLLK